MMRVMAAKVCCQDGQYANKQAHQTAQNQQRDHHTAQEAEFENPPERVLSEFGEGQGTQFRGPHVSVGVSDGICEDGGRCDEQDEAADNMFRRRHCPCSRHVEMEPHPTSTAAQSIFV